MPRVLTQAEAEVYHRLPGDKDLAVESYSPPIDWRTVPPWKQASFFGVRAKGQLFVFVVDCSGSMADNLRLYRAKQELRRCIAQLRHPQQFQIIFYNDRPLPMPGGIPQSASNKAQTRIASWIESIDSEGGTDPKAAMNLALSVRPDAVFLLSDGEFPQGTDSAISAQNSRRVPIHCIDLSGGAAGQQLRRIASDSGGQYAARP